MFNCHDFIYFCEYSEKYRERFGQFGFGFIPDHAEKLDAFFYVLDLRIKIINYIFVE